VSIADSHHTALARLAGQEATLRKEMARHEADAAKALDDMRRAEESAGRTKSATTLRSHLNTADRARKKAVESGKKAAAVSQKLAQNANVQAGKTRLLRSAEASERKAAQRVADQRRRKETEHAKALARLSKAEVRYVHIRPPEPETLRVLYLTANPAMDLRTDVEVRQVQQALRGAKYRDRVMIAQRPAATFQDLLDGLNDIRPHIVHFSGHGAQGLIQLESGVLEENDGALVSFEMFLQALDATDTPPTLLVLNACDTLEGAELLLPAVPIVIAMADSVSDIAATVFAQQFYAAVGSGQSVGSALKQGKIKVASVMIDDGADALPQHLAREGIDIDQIVLVQLDSEAGA
jgi:hypothetical protein